MTISTATSKGSTRATDPAAALAAGFRDAIVQAFGAEHASVDPMIAPSQRADFGDYQANVAMALAKRLGRKPHDVAKEIAKIAGERLFDVVESPDVAGPGFINLRLKSPALAQWLDAMDEPSLGVAPDPDATHSIVVDLCGVNVAKQMHVGHLRATIIGDGVARIYERLGRTVHRENHLGDWGLPIAMVLHHLRQQRIDLSALTIDALDRAYREAQQAGKDNPAAVEGAKRTLLQLQQGDSDVVRDWHALIDRTLREMYDVLDLLNVKIRPEHNRGESFYRDQLAEVIDAFMRAGIAKEDQGAIIVPFADRERPLLIRKSDGGYLYATTDLAAVRYRVQTLGSSRVIYAVDARQRDHFKDVFDAARKIGWDRLPDGPRAELIHLPFGSVLGLDKRPLKTRSGENVTLKALLAEAIERGAAEVVKRAADPGAPTHGLPAPELAAIARAVGIGAVKYADLSNDLVRDYVFDFDRMIAFEGNTGPYLQYAHARICSIFTRAHIDPQSLAGAPFHITDLPERSLALALVRYGGTVHAAANSLELHRLCAYLYDLANTYSTFYEKCPVLRAENEELKRSRLRLSHLTRRVLADGLGLLGIEAPQRM